VWFGSTDVARTEARGHAITAARRTRRNPPGRAIWRDDCLAVGTYGRSVGRRSWAVFAVLAGACATALVAVVLVSESGDGQDLRTVNAADRRLSVDVPDYWHQANERGLFLFTDRRHSPSTCPESFKSMWIFVTVRGDDPTALERPTRIDGTTGSRLHAGASDDLVCGQTEQIIRFREKGFYVDAAIIWGPDTPTNQIDDAYAILNSMTVHAATP